MTREIQPQEVKLVRALLKLAGENDPRWEQQVHEARVEPLNDGGMGSFRFEPRDPHRHFGRELVRAAALDRDNIRVEMALIADDKDDLFELEIWKVNFAPLVTLPEPEALKVVRES